MAQRTPSQSGAPLSLEASLDEENRQVLAALDGPRSRSPALRQANRNVTPPPPIRSMLDVNHSPASTPRHGSIAGIGVGVTSPRQDKNSRLDPADPSTWTSPHSSKPNSPTLSRKEPVARPRGGSDDDSQGEYVGLPRAEPGRAKGFEQNYNFDLSSIPSTTKSTRSREDSGGGAMAAAMSGELSNLHVGLPAGHSNRHNSTSATGQHSTSPSGRITSPVVQSPGLLSPTSPRKLTTPSGTVVDDSAHRRLSNKSSSFSTVTDDSEEGAGRVPVDRPPEEQALDDSSDDQQHSSGSDDDTRGRSRGSKEASDVEPDTPQTAESDKEQTQPPKKKESRSQVIKSLLEPSIKVTSPSGEKMNHGETGVHPPSNFDARRPSISATSMASNDDDTDAIAIAKTLALNISPLDTKVPDRHVRMIIRGDWSGIHKVAEAGDKTVRTYLACTDLSQEATYALEWTVGTIMRDGDTLLAIYSIEHDAASGPGSNNSKVSEAEKEKLHQEGAQAGKDASDAMEKLTRQATNTDVPHQSKFVPATEVQSLTGSVDARKVGKKEMERLKAIDEITQTFLRLVRKTTLQVRCMIEVIHCKSPKHLILGAVSTHNASPGF